jgi:tetratricopeptide (TPR) repeat protein
VGMTLALAFGFRALAFRLGRKHLSIIILPVLLVLAAISWDRNADWISEAQLFETEYQSGPPGVSALRVLIATHYNQGRFHRVEEICDENASRFKRNIGFTHACAINYIRQARMDDAIAALETYVREGKDDNDRTTARLELVPIYLALENYQQVASQYAAIIEEEEDPAYKEFYKGELLLTLFPEDREQLQKARQLFRQALEKDPKLRAAQKLITRIDRKLAEPD